MSVEASLADINKEKEKKKTQEMAKVVRVLPENMLDDECYSSEASQTIENLDRRVKIKESKIKNQQIKNNQETERPKVIFEEDEMSGEACQSAETATRYLYAVDMINPAVIVDPNKKLTHKEKKRIKKEKKKAQIRAKLFNKKDIKYRGLLSYRHLRIIAWISLAVGQMYLFHNLNENVFASLFTSSAASIIWRSEEHTSELQSRPQ